MEHQLWKDILAVLNSIDKPRKRTDQDYSCEDIVRVWFWSVLHDRPISWAVERVNWPLHDRRRQFPSSSTMTRRLQDPGVVKLIAEIEEKTFRSQADHPPLAWVMDGKPLPVSGISKDKQAGYGRAARGKAKGYKLHVIQGIDGSLAAWRVAPMNKDERVIGRRMVRDAEIQGYLLADGNYDSNGIHKICYEKGELQLVAPLRGGTDRKKRRKKQEPGRQRAQELFESPCPLFGKGLMDERGVIERSFGNLTNWGGGLTHLPPWARTYRRVHRWVQAKLIINAIRRTRKKSYVTA
jgi:hypothetical protein